MLLECLKEAEGGQFTAAGPLPQNGVTDAALSHKHACANDIKRETHSAKSKCGNHFACGGGGDCLASTTKQTNIVRDTSIHRDLNKLLKRRTGKYQLMGTN